VGAGPPPPPPYYVEVEHQTTAAAKLILAAGGTENYEPITASVQAALQGMINLMAAGGGLPAAFSVARLFSPAVSQHYNAILAGVTQRGLTCCTRKRRLTRPWSTARPSSWSGRPPLAAGGIRGCRDWPGAWPAPWPRSRCGNWSARRACSPASRWLRRSRSW